MNEKLKNVFEPSEKVQKMYEAIVEMVEEARDLSTLKVSEITTRAGIGKGTAYEYFSSKEELLIYATMWLCGKQLDRIVEECAKLAGFRDKFFFLMEWVRTHKAYHDLFFKAMRGGLQEDCEKIKNYIPEEMLEKLRTHIEDQINELVESGFQEGIFTEQDVEKRTIVFVGALMQYAFAGVKREEGMKLCMNEEQLRDFTYECMVKALN